MHIDPWTLALQAINVLVLIWILQRFLFRPILAIVDRRRQETEQAMQATRAALAEAEAARAEAEKRLAGIRAEADLLLSDAQTAAAHQTAALLADNEQRIAEQRQAAQAAIEADRQSAQAEIVQAASELGQTIAARLLQRLPDDIAFAHFLTGLVRALQDLPEATRAELAQAARSEAGIELRSAAPLSSDQMAVCADALTPAFGFRPTLRNAADGRLLAGLELHAPHCSLLNSWGADLAALRDELGSRSAGAAS